MSATNASDCESLGILSMDNLQVFGETSSNSSSKISDRLKMERTKALETLQKSQNGDGFKTPQNKEEKKKTRATDDTTLDQTDYVPLCQLSSINISDLVIDNTINMENSSLSTSTTSNKTNNKVNISFEPNEITGRSTLYKNDSNAQRKTSATPLSSRYSVCDILSSSFAPKARDLCEAFRREGCGASGVSSSLTSLNTSRSLPRTADMSLSKKYGTGDGLFNNGTISSSFSFGPNSSACSYADYSFAPAEMMQSKMLKDEISWAQQRATVPTNVLSEAAKTKLGNSAVHTTTDRFDMSTMSNFRNFEQSYSFGKFFNMRSEDISNIYQHESPRTTSQPIALVDESECKDSATTTAITSGLESSSLNCSTTPKIDNKIFSRVDGCQPNKFALHHNNNKKQEMEKHESKDSGNTTDNSYFLSVSAISRAMYDIDIQTDDSGAAVFNQILENAKKFKSNTKKSPLRGGLLAENKISNRPSTDAVFKARAYETIISINENILENKENLDPQPMRGGTQLSDTLSFTDSLLSANRSPLSPINVGDIPIIKVTDNGAEEADDEAYPTTPLKSINRRVRRTKSPCADRKTPSPQTENPLKPKNSTPRASSNKPNLCSTLKKSVRSNRIESNKTQNNKNDGCRCDLVVSPNPCKNVNGNMLTPSRTGSSDCSPISSPRSCLSPQSSPTSGFRSPQLDNTTNSERRFLTANVSAAAKKTVSSPVTSESSASSVCTKYGVPAMPMASTSSHRSMYCTAGRSVSRCSNSSEFSHRDGKVIPLKVTTLELSWSSTKLRTDARKSMQVKNIATKRLVIRIVIHGPGFQIISNSSSQNNTLNLQSQECRSILINFCPTVTGPAIGRLSFHSPLGTVDTNTSFLDIPLFGYGGHATIIPQNILKGPVGAPFLPMGDRCQLSRSLERTFRIHNKGPLLAFAVICIDSLGFNAMPCLSDSFEVQPSCVLVAPDSIVEVRLIFRPKRDDVKKIMKKISNVLTLANLRIISGDEANRQRMRRLVKRMPSSERDKIRSNTLDKLWTQFPNEVEMHELKAFTENTKVASDLLTAVRIQDIALTLNHDNLDESAETSSVYFPDADETLLYRTVWVASPTPVQNALEPVEEYYENTQTAPKTECDIVSKQGTKDSCSVSPKCIEFDFMSERRTERVSLLIRNNFQSRQYFEVVCNHKNILRFTPSVGYVAPDGGQIEVEIHATCDKLPVKIKQCEPIEIQVLVENEQITVPVKIPNDNYTPT